MASDKSKTASQVISGYAIRNGLAQKMAPGDKMFYMISQQADGKNAMKSFSKRFIADAAFKNLKDPKVLISGETGDLLASDGD
jgi:hypothetical protein